MLRGRNSAAENMRDWVNPIVYRSGPTTRVHPAAWNETAALLPFGWRQQLWTDRDVTEYVVNHSRPRLKRCFWALLPWSYRADLFRLLILYERGGVWMDFSTQLMVSLDDVLTSRTSLALVHERKGFGMDYGIFNAFMAARRPRHPFIGRCIDLLLESCEQREYGATPWSVTGPELLGRVALRWPRLVARATWFWHAQEGGFIRTAGGRRVLVTKHSDHQTYVPQSGTYGGLWERRRIWNTTKLESDPRAVRRRAWWWWWWWR